MDFNFLDAVLLYLDPSSISPQFHRWQPPQLQELQIHGLTLLTNLLPLIPEYIHNLKTHELLVRMMQSYTDDQRRMACMKAIIQASKFEFFKNNFNNSGIIDALLDIIAEGSSVPLD